MPGSNRLKPEEVALRERIAVFTGLMRTALLKDKRWGPFARIPPNRRPFYISVIRDFEAGKMGAGRWASQSGMTVQILAAWLKWDKRKFTITYEPGADMFEMELK